MSIFGPVNIPTNAYNNCRVYGTILCFLMFVCVFIGVKFVSKFSPIALFCVIFSILCVYIGIFAANPSRGPQSVFVLNCFYWVWHSWVERICFSSFIYYAATVTMRFLVYFWKLFQYSPSLWCIFVWNFVFFSIFRVCFLGDRLLAWDKIRDNTTGDVECNKFENGSIYALYCERVKAEPDTGQEVQVTAENDDYCRYFHEHDVSLRPGIPGLASGVFLSKFLFVAYLFSLPDFAVWSIKRWKLNVNFVFECCQFCIVFWDLEENKDDMIK